MQPIMVALESVSNDIDHSVLDRNEAHSRIKKLLESQTDLEKRCHQLDQALANAAKFDLERSDAIRKLENALGRAQDDLQKANGQLKSLQADVEDRQTQIAFLKDQARILSESVETLTQTKNDLERSNRESAKQARLARDKNIDLMNALEKATDKIAAVIYIGSCTSFRALIMTVRWSARTFT